MIELLFFGQLTDVTGVSTMKWEMVTDSDTLLQQVKEKYPALQMTKFRLAVDNKMINGSVDLKPNSRIAFMPPFSGG